MRANPDTSADGGWRVLFAFVAQWPAAAEFCRSTPMRSFIYLLVLSVPFISGCGRAVSSSDISAYGVDRFVTNVLAFQTTHATSGDIQKEFSPKRVEEYLNGVLLVYSESSKWTQGIYVDRKEVARWGGSGLEVEQWFPQIAWVQIKKRGLSNQAVQRTGASRWSADTNRASSAAGSGR
jgi:hypothetical protein